MAQGEIVLPDGERVARELAKFPKSMRGLIWRRAQQIDRRRRPDYLAIRKAALEIVPRREAKQIMLSEFLERLRTAKRALSVSLDLSGVSIQSLKIICTLLVEIEKRVGELSVEAGSRLSELQKKPTPP
jgi:hypothetical protein